MPLLQSHGAIYSGGTSSIILLVSICLFNFGIASLGAFLALGSAFFVFMKAKLGPGPSLFE